MQKRRFNFAFNLENEKHARAYEILSNYPNRRRCEFVIQSILAYEDCEKLKNLVYDAVQSAIAELDIEYLTTLSQRSEQKRAGDDDNSTIEISGEALSFLSSL